MKGRLYCPVGELQVDALFLGEAVIGRNPQCTVQVPFTLVSGHHARIAWNAERKCYVLEDLGSSNGTRLDGEVVVEPRLLGHLHVITLSETYELVFQDLERCDQRHGTIGGKLPAAAAADPSGATVHTSIEVLDLALPGPLQKRKVEREKTLLQRFDLPLPGLLRGSAEDDGGTGTDRLEEPEDASESTARDPSPGDRE